MINYKKISSFDTEDRLPTFRKNLVEEFIVQRINDHLRPVQKFFAKETRKRNHQILLILGAPRSGSTLLNQVLVSRLDLGYPSNLMARFYEAPAVGAFLQKLLIKDRIKDLRKYKSIHGVTELIEEPHEFGYFWSRHLAVSEDVHEPNENEIHAVNIRNLDNELQTIISIFNKSVIFKCLLVNFFIPVLKQIPNILFIDLQRNPIELARSIWLVRQERLGNVEKWWSLRPRNYSFLKRLTPAQQIAGQILAIRASIANGLSCVEENRKLTVSYENLIRNPEAVIDRTVEKIFRLGARVEKIGEPISYVGHPGKKNLDPAIESEIVKAFDDVNALIKL
ncbi:MAG: sulfotransferase [Deltaproteobacteria bacterium]|nr:sulfotransferase [Deltaproteobacteria bacterium]MBW2301385.1 sulfotransferase [Deltaproteobacteria bacterium]